MLGDLLARLKTADRWAGQAAEAHGHALLPLLLSLFGKQLEGCLSPDVRELFDVVFEIN